MIYQRMVPPHLQAAVADGTMQVVGSVIRDIATGKGEGFLVEAAPLATLVARGPQATAQIGLEAASLVQGELIRAGVNRIEEGVKTLINLGTANLALGGANLGVSVVGFAVIAAQIQVLKRRVDLVSDQVALISAKIDQLQRDAIDAEFAEVEALALGYEEGWRLSDAAALKRWEGAARDALALQTRFEKRAVRALGDGISHYAVAEPFLDALHLTNGLRVAALSASNEILAARFAADEGARSIDRLTGGIGLADLVRGEMTGMRPVAGTTSWALAQTKAKVSARDSARRMRLREALAGTRAAPLVELERRGIAPRDALAEARSESSSPFLFLPDGGAAVT